MNRTTQRLVILAAAVCMPVLFAGAQSQPAAPQGSAPAQNATPPKGDDIKALAARPTPKTSDGHPDLGGRWIRATDEFSGFVNASGVHGNVHDLVFGKPITSADPDKDAITAQSGCHAADCTKERQAKGKPSYKPEFQAKVDQMATDANHFDPTTFACLPSGVPRMGAPGLIVQQPGLVILLYGPSPYSTYRTVPTDGRPHRSGDSYDENPMGDPVGHWEGDTLVIETTGFDDSTWFGADGYFHTDAMKVTERFTRKGDTLEYSAVVEDPNVLTEPFKTTPSPLEFKKGGANDILYNDDYPCDATAHDFRAHADHSNHL
jgi:hypothetical protein